jgi:hypothetical protein
MALADLPTPRPWQMLPGWFGERLREEIPAIAEDVVATIVAEIPEYGTIDGAFGRDLRRGVADGLLGFLAVVEARAPTLGPAREVYEQLGLREWRAGRTLDALQAAYRVGARVAWRRIAAVGETCGASAAETSALAESVFAYLDELAGATVEAFAGAQALAAGERERRRHRLLALLLSAPPQSPSALERAAHEAGWPLPRTLAVAATDEALAAPAGRRLGADHLAGVIAGTGCVVVPDPGGPGRRGQLASALADMPVAIGPAVAPQDAARSWERAVSLRRLRIAGRLPRGGLQHADDHLLLLLLAEDPTLVEDLAAVRLAPLGELPPRSRERLEETLLAFLRHRGNGPRVAAELHVHPQTVRYRVGRLRELLGDHLDDPDVRFELEVVLRARRQPITERTSGS